MSRSMAAAVAVVAVIMALAVTSSAGSYTMNACAAPEAAFDVCVPFLVGKLSDFPKECCGGIEAVVKLAAKGDPSFVCECLKQHLVVAGGVNPKLGNLFLGFCGIPTNVIPISRNYDCMSIS